MSRRRSNMSGPWPTLLIDPLNSTRSGVIWRRQGFSWSISTTILSSWFCTTVSISDTHTIDIQNYILKYIWCDRARCVTKLTTCLEQKMPKLEAVGGDSERNRIKTCDALVKQNPLKNHTLWFITVWTAYTWIRLVSGNMDWRVVCACLNLAMFTIWCLQQIEVAYELDLIEKIIQRIISKIRR